jgi:hypothetical protein
VDALEAAQCVVFSPDGSRIVGGYFQTKSLKVFHTAIPGRQCDTWQLNKTKQSGEGQQGLPSAITFLGDLNASGNSVLAVGTYGGSIYVYDDRVANVNDSPTVTVLSGLPVVSQSNSFARRHHQKRRLNSSSSSLDSCVFAQAKTKLYQKAVKGGITQLKAASPGNPYTLLSASRRSRHIVSWDLRMLQSSCDTSDHNDNDDTPTSIRGVHMFDRGDGNGDSASPSIISTTNQHLQFDVSACGTRLLTPYHHHAGNHANPSSSSVAVYDIVSGKLVQTVDVDATTSSSSSSNGNGNSNSNVATFINGVAQSPTHPNAMAISTGTRTFDNSTTNNDNDTDTCSSDSDEAEAGPTSGSRIGQRGGSGAGAGSLRLVQYTTK